MTSSCHNLSGQSVSLQKPLLSTYIFKQFLIVFNEKFYHEISVINIFEQCDGVGILAIQNVRGNQTGQILDAHHVLVGIICHASEKH